MNNIVNTVPYLKTSREFPEDAENLSNELDKTYIEIAQAVNLRTIGIYSTNRPSITGNSYFLTSSRRQTLRQVYVFSTTTTITHNIRDINPNDFTNCNGSYTDGTNDYGIIWGSSVAIPGQISFYLTSTQIIFVVDGAAPSLTSGRIILEWISNV
jgi:hypothetical protein